MNNLVGQPVLELPVNVHGMVWEEDAQKAHSHQNEMVHPALGGSDMHRASGWR